MILHTVRGSDNIPPNSVKLSRSEALKYQQEVVRDWKDATDVIFLRNAKFLATGVVFASSYIIVRHFRKMLKLGNNYTLVNYIPILGLTPGVVFLKFDNYVTNNVLLMEMKCPLCWQIKYSFHQTFCGFLFPVILGCFTSSAIAKEVNSMPVPDISREPKKYFQFFYKYCRSGGLTFQILASLHILTALFWPYMQSVELSNVTNKLREKFSIQNERL